MTGFMFMNQKKEQQKYELVQGMPTIYYKDVATFLISMTPCGPWRVSVISYLFSIPLVSISLKLTLKNVL